MTAAVDDNKIAVVEKEDEKVIDLSSTKLPIKNSVRDRAMVKELVKAVTLKQVNNKTLLKDKSGKKGEKNARTILNKIGASLSVDGSSDVANRNTPNPPPKPWADGTKKPPDWVELLEQELPDEKLLAKHNDLLEAKSEKVQMSALKEAYRIKGRVAPEKVEHSFRPMMDIGDDELDKQIEEAERTLNRLKREQDCDVIEVESVT